MSLICLKMMAALLSLEAHQNTHAAHFGTSCGKRIIKFHRGCHRLCTMANMVSRCFKYVLVEAEHVCSSIPGGLSCFVWAGHFGKEAWKGVVRYVVFTVMVIHKFQLVENGIIHFGNGYRYKY